MLAHWTVDPCDATATTEISRGRRYSNLILSVAAPSLAIQFAAPSRVRVKRIRGRRRALY